MAGELMNLVVWMNYVVSHKSKNQIIYIMSGGFYGPNTDP